MDRDAIIAAMIFAGSGSGGGGGADAPFVIKFTKQNNNIIADKTATEVNNAIAAGKTMIALATADLFGGSASHIVQLELSNTGSSVLGDCIQFSSRVTIYGGNTYPTVNAYRIMGVSILGDIAWTPFTDTAYLPPILSGDAAKILAVTDVSNKTVGWTVDKGAPFEVEFTITGQPSGTSYPVSVAATLASIYAALLRGDRVYASVAMSASDYAMGALSGLTPNGNGGLAGVCFDIISVLVGVGTVVLGHAVISDDGNGEVASLDIIPLSTAQMTYDSGTQTLAIVDPLA